MAVIAKSACRLSGLTFHRGSGQRSHRRLLRPHHLRCCDRCGKRQFHLFSSSAPGHALSADPGQSGRPVNRHVQLNRLTGHRAGVVSNQYIILGRILNLDRCKAQVKAAPRGNGRAILRHWYLSVPLPVAAMLKV